MLDDVTTQERYGLVVAAAVLLAAGFGAGSMVSGSAPTGNVAASGDDAGTAAIQQQVQQLMDRQMQGQQQQLQQLAEQRDNLSADDLSMDATVTDVSQSQFAGLYKVAVSIQGQAPSQTGELQQIDQTQEFYISQDGRYLFRSPTDLEQPRQPQPPTGGQ
jgi:hypothetical protein